MPRKLRTPKARRDAPLTAALRYLVTTGEQATARMAGWVELAQHPDVDAAVQGAWAGHSDALTAEAAAHGFKPYGLTRRTPTGSAFEQWRSRFLAEHAY